MKAGGGGLYMAKKKAVNLIISPHRFFVVVDMHTHSVSVVQEANCVCCPVFDKGKISYKKR